jgi:hypothetical protein
MMTPAPDNFRVPMRCAAETSRVALTAEADIIGTNGHIRPTISATFAHDQIDGMFCALVLAASIGAADTGGLARSAGVR